MNALANFVVKFNRLIIIVFAVLTVVFAFGLTKLEMDSSVSAMYPDKSDIIDVQDEITRVFGSGQLLIAMVTGNIYTPEALAALQRIDTALHRATGINSVNSIAGASRMEDDDGFLINEPLLSPAVLAGDAAAITELREFLRTSSLYSGGVLVADAGTSANVVVKADDSIDSEVIIANLREALTTHWVAAGLGEYALAGGPLVDLEMRTTINRDLPLLSALAVLAIFAMLFINFRTAHGTLLPLATILVGLGWSMGLMGWFGGKISTLSVIAPVAVLAVGSSFALHLLGRYYFERSHQVERLDAVRVSVRETGVGILISGFAIAAAISTFYLSGMPTVRALGLTIAGGVLASLLATMVLLPALLSVLPAPKNVSDPESETGLGRPLRALARFVSRFRVAILVVGGLLGIAAAIGASLIVADSAVLNYFRDDSEVRQSYDKIEEAFGGTSQVQMLVQGDLHDPAVLRALLDYQEEIKTLDEMGPTTSIATVIREIHRVLGGAGDLPATREEVAQELLIYQMSGDVQEISEFITLDGSEGLMEIAVTSGSTGDLRITYDRLRSIAEPHFAGLAEVSFAGSALMQLAIEDSMRADFLVSLTLAVLLVIIIDSFVRSIPAALVTIVALLLTILMQYGALGFIGIPLDLATMLLGALAIGVGDYAIHLTVRYMEELHLHPSPEEAMERAMVSSGRSILFTALTLGAGFGALLVSQFVPILTLGSLMTFTVISVGIISLTVLPAACLIFLRKPRLKKKGPQHA